MTKAHEYMRSGSLHPWAMNAIQNWSKLADHLGCDPSELEGVDLRKWHIALDETLAALIDGDRDMLLEARRLIRRALAQLPEKQNADD